MWPSSGSYMLFGRSTQTERCFCRKSSGMCGQGIRWNQVNFMGVPRLLPLWWRRRTTDAMQNRFIDLYSDTKSKPSPGMRKAMAEAEVGDEQKFEDPTVERLRERICEILGKEDAVFMPSGTMCNQSAIRVHCRLGDEVIADRTAHIINAETGGTAANSGVMIRMLDGPNGVFTADQVKAALRDPNSRNAPRSRLVSVENTSNGGFGTVWPLATLQGVSKVAHDAGLAVHMDGARLRRLRRFTVARLHQGSGRAGRRVARGLEGLHQGGLAAEADAGWLDAP